VELTIAKLIYRFFCYYKLNVADLIVQNTGLESLKPQFGTGTAPPAPVPKKLVGGVKRIIRESKLLFLHQFYCLVWSYKQYCSLDSNTKFSSLPQRYYDENSKNIKGYGYRNWRFYTNNGNFTLFYWFRIKLSY